MIKNLQDVISVQKKNLKRKKKLMLKNIHNAYTVCFTSIDLHII